MRDLCFEKVYEGLGCCCLGQIKEPTWIGLYRGCGHRGVLPKIRGLDCRSGLFGHLEKRCAGFG